MTTPSIPHSTSTFSESVTEYLTRVLAGLAGSTHMVAATIISLSRLVYEFHGNQYTQLSRPPLTSPLPPPQMC